MTLALSASDRAALAERKFNDEVAARYGYRIGQQIVLSHGSLGGEGGPRFADHADKPFTIVGILARSGTPLDRALLVSLEGIEAIHIDWLGGAPMPGVTIAPEHVRKFDLRPKSVTAALVGLIYPVFEGMVWNGNYGFQEWLTASFGAPFMDFAGSVVVHAVGGWIALAAVLLLGSRRGRYTKDGRISSHPPSSIPFLALGSWVLAVGWFGFNVMSAQKIEGISGLVAVNSLMAMVGGTLGALLAGRNDPGFAYNGPLAGLVAVCAGSNIMHPLGSLAVGSIAGVLFVYMFTFTQNRLKIDDVLGVWPLHGICGAFGGIAAGVFGQQALGGMGGVSFMSQLIGTVAGVAFALVGGFVVYGLLKITVGIRLNDEEEFNGADLTIHKVSASPERETSSW